MPAEIAVAASEPSPAAVLSKASLRAADLLGITNGELATILGVSASTVSRMKEGRYELKRGKKEFELAQLFVRMFRGLDAITGSFDESSASWVRSENRALAGDTPLSRMKTVRGLVEVVDYVDASRALT